MFKVYNRNIRTRCEICSKLIIKAPEQCHWRCSGVFIWRGSGFFIVKFEHVLPCSCVCIVNFEQVNAGGSGFNQKVVIHILDIAFKTQPNIFLPEIHLKLVKEVLVVKFLIGRCSVGRWSMHLVGG